MRRLFLVECEKTAFIAVNAEYKYDDVLDIIENALRKFLT